MSEYYRLIGLKCSTALRRRLDVAFFTPPNPTSERFAAVNRRYDGSCPMFGNDGLCTLQTACGETILPSVCRYFPRAPHFRYGYECSCSPSCEAVTELLLHRTLPITFVDTKLDFEIEFNGKPDTDGYAKSYGFIQKTAYRLLTDRSRPLEMRLAVLGSAARRVNRLFESKDFDAVAAYVPDSIDYQCTDKPLADYTHTTAMVSYFGKLSENVSAYSDPALSALKNEDDYLDAAAEFYNKFPSCDDFFESLLINHAFYREFPFFPGSHHGITESFQALCAVYSMLKLISVGYTRGKEGEEPLVDCVSSAFRFMDNSDFDLRAVSFFAHCVIK